MSDFDVRAFVSKTIRSCLMEEVNSIIDGIYVKYETNDGLAYADIEKLNNKAWHISLIESRRKGGGSELMKKIITDAKNSGVEKITLATTEHSGWGFFDRFGFKEIGDNNDPYDIPMVLYLKTTKEYLKELEGSNNKLIPTKTNKYVYHTSNPMFRDKISKEGLIPKGKSETWLSDTKIDGKVIFAVNSDNKDDWWDSTYDDDLYRIDTTKLNNKWYYDPNFITGIYASDNPNKIITFEKIPLNAIELIYKGTGKGEDEDL